MTTHPSSTKRLTWLSKKASGLILVIGAALVAAAASAENGKTDDQISLTVASFERMQQYPPPPVPERVFVVSAGAGHELAVITIKVTGSVAFEDYKMTAGASATDVRGVRHPAALSKPLKSGSQPEVWDKQILVFPLKKDTKLKSLSVGEMTFDLTKVQES